MMIKLETISGLDESALELLEAAGFTTLESLAEADPAELTAELEGANRVLKLAPSSPAGAEVAGWVREARERCGLPAEAEAEESALQQETSEAVEAPAVEAGEPINYEEVDEVLRQLERAPLAIPLPARLLVEGGVPPAEIPAAPLLTGIRGELDVRVDDERRLPRQRVERRSGSGVSYVQVADAQTPSRLELDTSRVRALGEEADEAVRATTPRRRQRSTPEDQRSPHEERIALIRAPREGTNRGRDPRSRTYVRGVLHSHPGQLAFGAVITLLLLVDLPLAVISSALLIASQQAPDAMHWVPSWLLVFPAVLPLLGIAYLIWGLNGSCRICGQRLFLPRKTLKNIKAHHVPLLGYIVPVCLHMLVFRWFRCTYCGTPVRIKK